MNEPSRVKVLFVCMGNICRSPTAHGVFRKLVEEAGLADRFVIDSAGTHAYHVGEPPDRRARETAQRRGVALHDIRARRALAKDFELFDYILAMDADNYQSLSQLCPGDRDLEPQLLMLMDFAPHMETQEVPDPYYGGPGGFETVFDMVEAAAQGLLEHLRERHALAR